jgi:superfamily II DNA/RNA helicase
MVRRLKSDLRAIGKKFPKRNVGRIQIDRLPENAPELALSRLLQQYRKARERRLMGATRSQQASAMLVVVSLQKRLLSSIEAFVRTLDVHRDGMLKVAGKVPAVDSRNLDLLSATLNADDERAELSEEDVEREEDAQMLAATLQSKGEPSALGPELVLLDEMIRIARGSRYDADPRVRHLLGWIRQNQCPNLGTMGATWLPRRVLIFTDYSDTKRYLEQVLGEKIRDSDQGSERVATFHGNTPEKRREAIKAAFNADPLKHPLRILIATDAAREGVNLQNNCADLFHFDVPWNPSKIEQRNGRIDRTLQKADEVNCMYFVLPQRAEDRVLDVLVAKTRKIYEELGSLAPVVGPGITEALAHGIEHEGVGDLVSAIEKADADGGQFGERVRTVQIEMAQDEVDSRRVQLDRQLSDLLELLERSRRWIGLDDRHFRDALSASLETVGAEGLIAANNAEAAADPDRARWLLPHLHERKGADPTWAGTLDSLRVPRKEGQSLAEWRRAAPIRPVVFKDSGNLDGEVVHLHLEHRVVRRLLGRFLSQGFRDDDLRRACVLRTVEAQPRAVLLGRLSLFGDGGARLHDEVLAAAAEWIPVEQRRGGLRPLREGEKADVLALVEEGLAQPRLREAGSALQDRLRAHAARDVSELTPHLEARAAMLVERAQRDLAKRGETEARDMASILEGQRTRIQARQREIDEESRQGRLAFNPEEERQLAADRRYWVDRLQAIARELDAEPDRIRKSYVVRATRVESVGIVYLWPLSS